MVLAKVLGNLLGIEIAAGIPAMLLLPLTTMVGFCIFARGSADYPSPVHKKVATVTGTYFFVAVIFWVWALVNTLTFGSFDLGSITFALVMAASTAAWRSAKGEGGVPGVNFYKVAMPVACWVVSANYFLAVMITEGWLRFYVVFGTLYWITAGAVHVMFARSLETLGEH